MSSSVIAKRLSAPRSSDYLIDRYSCYIWERGRPLPMDNSRTGLPQAMENVRGSRRSEERILSHSPSVGTGQGGLLRSPDQEGDRRQAGCACSTSAAVMLARTHSSCAASPPQHLTGWDIALDDDMLCRILGRPASWDGTDQDRSSRAL